MWKHCKNRAIVLKSTFRRHVRFHILLVNWFSSSLVGMEKAVFLSLPISVYCLQLMDCVVICPWTSFFGGISSFKMLLCVLCQWHLHPFNTTWSRDLGIDCVFSTFTEIFIISQKVLFFLQLPMILPLLLFLLMLSIMCKSEVHINLKVIWQYFSCYSKFHLPDNASGSTLNVS